MLGLALAAVLLLAAPAAAQPRSFTIDRFAADLAVGADGSLDVRETLTIAFRGRHQGVWRAIPIRYVRHGLEYALRIDRIVVLDEASRPLRTEITYPGRSVRIKAWVPGAENARRTIHVVYRVRRGLLAFDDHDELYWNVTGDEWDAPIAAGAATVTLPAAVDSASVRTAAYTGPRGATGADVEEAREGGRLVFRTTRQLRPREGLTIVVGWPAGAVARPAVWRQAWWLAADNWPLTLPVGTLVLVFLLWRAYGRDPLHQRSVKPEYGPPPGLSPAEAGALIDQRAEPSDVVATLIDLGVRGYLRVERLDGGDFRFQRLRPLATDPMITPLERTILQKVFGEDLSLKEHHLSELRRDYDYVFAPLRDAIYRAMVSRRLFAASPYWVRQGWLVAGGVLCMVAGMLFVVREHLGPVDWTPAAGVALSALAVLGAAPFMPRRTWQGARLLTALRGFQEFLERAEKDRLERLPPDTLHRWLPWAIALGVTGRWIHNWHGLPVAAATWYDGRDGFELAGYERTIEDFGRSNAVALTTGRAGDGGAASGDSGFSGGGSDGGSSGGGFGGGGGGTF